jgi:hypothetical protein
MWIVVNVTLRPGYPQETDPVSISQEAGWVLGPVLTGVENLALPGIRFPDRSVRSESLSHLERRKQSNDMSQPHLYVTESHVLKFYVYFNNISPVTMPR